MYAAGARQCLAPLIGRNAEAFRGAAAAHTVTEKAFRVRNVFVPIRPECAGEREGLASPTAQTRKALAHGGLSSQNNLIGQSRPVFFATVYAWFSDPASGLNRPSVARVWRPYQTGNYLA